MHCWRSRTKLCCQWENIKKYTIQKYLYSASRTRCRHFNRFCIVFIQSYFNGVEEGAQKKWYANKQLAEERFYINGKKEGIHKGWWPDGKPKFIFDVANDEYSGEFKEWYSSGLLGKQFHYNNGQEEGSERLWWDNGTVRANYVIRNGKKYGLIGLKTCVNPYDSIIKK